MWLVINVVGIAWVLRYAARIRKNPKASPVYESDRYWRKREEVDLDSLEYYTPMSAWITFGILLAGMFVFAVSEPLSTLRIGNSEYTFWFIPLATGLFALTSILSLRKSVHFFVLNLLVFTIIYLIIGVMGYGWFVKEIATLFFVMGIFSGIAMNSGANRITKLFIEGMKDILISCRGGWTGRRHPGDS